MDIKQNLNHVNQQIKDACQNAKRNQNEVCLIAVSKTKPASYVTDAFNAGQTNFGENYIQEAMEKIETINNPDITWHFIGALQSNKAKFAVKYFDFIHSVDSLKLAKEINKRAKAENKIQNILIQVNTGKEEQKAGINPENVKEVFAEIIELENISVKGLMAIPPFGMTDEEAATHFSLLKNTFKSLNAAYPDLNMTELSMGMSQDFETAIKEGSTMVRVGTAIFGERVYKK